MRLENYYKIEKKYQYLNERNIDNIYKILVVLEYDHIFIEYDSQSFSFSFFSYTTRMIVRRVRR